jgi:hypothetical protein
MIPVRLLVVGPLRVIEVFLRLRLIVATVARLVLVDVAAAVIRTGQIVVDVFFNVVSLASDRIPECLIRLLNFLKHFFCFILFFRRKTVGTHKVRMVFLRHLVVGQLDLL